MKLTMREKKQVSAILIILVLAGGFFIFKSILTSKVQQPNLTGGSQNTGAVGGANTKVDGALLGISSISVTDVTSKSATIVWDTPTPADSTVLYGTNDKYGKSVVDKTLTTNHSIALSSLTPDTTYSFQVLSTDALGVVRTGVGGGFTARTSTGGGGVGPVFRIQSVTLSGITTTQGTVSWTTNRAATSVIEYGFTPAYGQTFSNGALTLNHAVTVSPLLEGRHYHFRVKSVDAGGLVAVTGDYTLDTASPLTCPNAPTTPYEKAMYVWQENTLIITQGSTQQNDLFAYTDAKKVQRIYLNANKSDLIDPVFKTNLKTFLNTAWNQHCLKVELLSGAGNWLAYPNNGYIKGECYDGLDNETLVQDGVPPDGLIDYPADPECTSIFDTNEAIAGAQSDYSTEAVDWIQAGIAFQNTLSATDMRPAGFHADFEPHTWNVTDWPGFDHYWNWSNMTDNYYTVYAFLGALQNMKIAAAPSGIPLVLDAPRWFDSAFILQNITYHTLTQNLMKHVYPLVDEVTVLDYVTNGGTCATAGSICYDATAELDFGAQIGRPSSIAVETINVTGTGQTNGVNSFWTLACTDLTNALSTSYNAISASGKLAGFKRYSIHAFWDNHMPPLSGFKYLCP